MPAGDGEAMRGDRAGAVAIADRQRVLEHVLHPWSEVTVAVIADQRATPAQQMCETGLVDRVIEAPIGRPAITDERAGKLRPQDGRGFLVAPAGQNRVDGGVRRGERPQPVQLAADFPPGLIRGDYVAVPDLGAQRLVGGAGAIGGAVQGMDEPAGGDVQTKAVAKQGADFGQGQPELRMQHGGERHRLRPELRRGRAQGIGRLQAMSALHATPARAATANLDGERAHDRTHDGKIFLILLGDAEAAQRSLTLRAGRRQVGVIAFVNMRGDGAMGFAPIRSARPPAGTSWRSRRGAARERGRLAIHLAPRVIELIFEVLDLLAQRVAFVAVAIPVSVRSLVLASQTLDFALLPLELGDQLFTRRRPPLRLHASVMPRLSTKYKQKRMHPARRRPLIWSVTR